MRLPAAPTAETFDALHDDAAAWRDALADIGRSHGGGELVQESSGTVLVARLDRDRVLKVYPPFLRDHFEFEHAMLQQLHGRLRVPTPQLLADGQRDGWPYLVMTQLSGEPLTASWPRMSEAERCALLHEIGALAAEVHALPVAAAAAAAAPRWADFIAAQRARCVQRQQRTGLPAHLLEQLPPFLAGPLPEGPPVLLTGEYTPFNLFTTPQHRLAAMFDFGDGLVGPREYDWLGPQCFLVAGHRARSAAFIGGYGAAVQPAAREPLLRLLLLHRYSNLRAQVKIEGWQQLRSLQELAERLWPD
ncbi:MAG: aminoglycoside 3'-phosphotransferase/choline kinase family protein [Rubrivivax sp.]|nr:aminoglycoside 3'-phosphotransferase/choline kinase family protein [Rubrivivax sp.]